MQTLSPAGGVWAGHGGGLSPSDPPALSLLCLGGLELHGGHRDSLAPVLVGMVCSKVFQSQGNPPETR